MDSSAPDSVASRSAAGREANGREGSGSTPRVMVTTRSLPRGRLGSTATRLFRDPWQPTRWMRLQLLELNSTKLWRGAVLEAIFTGTWVFASILITCETVLWGQNLPGRTILVAALLHVVLFTLYIQMSVTTSTMSSTAGKDHHQGGQLQPIIGHLNPAVTAVHVLSGGMAPVAGLLFMMAQCGGAILGALCAKELLPQDRIDLLQLGGCYGRRTVSLQDGTSMTIGFSDHKYFLVEFAFSFTFLYVGALAVHPNQLRLLGLKWAVFYISANIGFNIYVSAAIRPGYSGSMFNPARCLASAVAYGQPLWDRLWPPFLAPFVAAVAVAFIFATMPPDHADRYAQKNDVISSIKRWSNPSRRPDFQSAPGSSRLDAGSEMENGTIYEVPAAGRMLSASPQTPDLRPPPETSHTV